MPAYVPTTNQQRAGLMLPVANFMPALPGMTALAGSMQDLCPLPRLARQHDRRREFSPLAEEKGGEALSPGAGLRAAHPAAR